MTDPELRKRFQELRRIEQQAAPRFSAMWREPAHRVSNPLLWARVAAVLILLLLGTVPLLLRRHSPHQQVAALTHWKSPTDFLLRTPGNELLTTLPRLGSAAVAESVKGVVP